jgi:TRAP-type C4-dicarboxylate transport system substrate-binding protein
MISMSRTFARCAALLAALSCTAATAEPIKLKLAYFSSDRSAPFQAAIRPFIDAVNSDAKGLMQIELYPSGALGSEIALQPQLVLDGGADLAFIVPGYSPQLFPDNAVIELPGLFRNAREATHVYTRLIAEKALRGYRDFIVIGAYATDPETIHGRVPIASLDDLKGKRIRVNNPGEAAALEKLGAIPVPLQVTAISDAMSSGAIDAAFISLAPLADFGISRVATHHFLVRTSTAPLALVMNRKAFDSLPKAAQAIIQKYSGTWAGDRFVESYGASDEKVLEQLTSDSKRHVILPTPADLKRAESAFKVVRDELVMGNAHYQSLLKAVENELGDLRQVE